MREVIAKKHKASGIIYFVVTLFGLGLTTAGAFFEEALIFIFALIFTVISGYLFVLWVMLPEDIISIDNAKELNLPHGKTIMISDVIDVSYSRATARGISYRWGRIKISTRLDEYKLDFVDDCENVSKRLTDMMYRAKYESET